MKLFNRSYPHPVVGNIVNGSPDVPGAQFQAAVSSSADKQQIYLEIAPTCSSSTLCELIKQGQAELAVHVECSNTVYRQAFVFSSLEDQRVGIPADRVNGMVEVNVFIVAAKDIHGYQVDGADSDYADATFSLRRGDFLAVSAPVSFEVIPGLDTLKNIGSIMQINASKSEGDLPMQIQYGRDKIIVVLSKPDFRQFRLLQRSDIAKGLLAAAVTLPALMHALQYLQENSSEYEEENPALWVRVLRCRIEELGLSLDMDKLEIAQRILELPVRRALVDSHTAVANQGTSDE